MAHLRALLLGGTTFFGRDIARQLLEAGHEVTLFTRGRTPPPPLPNLRHLRGDRGVDGDLERAAAAGPWDVVIDNLAFDGAQVASARRAFRNAGRYLLCSTVSVYRFASNPFPQPLVEDAVNHGLRPAAEDGGDVHWSYARGKLEAERVLLADDALGRRGPPWTILRPTVVYGPHDSKDRGFWYLARLLDGGPLLLTSDGAPSFRLAYSEDVARAFVAAATARTAEGQIYNVAQAEIVTLRNFLEVSADALGVALDAVPLPSLWAGELGGPLANLVNVVPSIDAARRDLGWAPTPFAKFVADTARWFRRAYEEGPAEIRQRYRQLLATRAEERTLADKVRAFR